MSEYKPCFNDVYIEHLLTLIARHEMLVTADILAVSRKVLLPAGQPLNASLLKQLKGQNLTQPLGANIVIGDGFSGPDLLGRLKRYFENDWVLSELFEKVEITDVLETSCLRLGEQPGLAQYSWVMSNCLPRQFERSLFCAWAAVALEWGKGKSEEQIYEAFVVGLMHEVGLLFLPATALKELEELSSADYSQMERHSRIGYEVLAFLPAVSTRISRAVLDHHEEVDGTGFPDRKIAKQLGPLGQLIHLLDSTHAIYVKHFKTRGRTLNDLIPIIQMNKLSRPGMPAADLVLLLRKGTATKTCSVPEELMPLFLKQVKDRHYYIKRFVEQAEIFVAQNQAYVANARIYSLSRLLEHITVSMHQSGLINDAYIRWLELVDEQRLQHAYREAEDVFLMMQEILYHIQRFLLRLGELIETEQGAITELTPIWAPNKSISLIEGGGAVASDRESAKASLENFSSQPSPTIPSELHKLWLTQIRTIKEP
ncbi:HD-GYP domain-containing protein [Teredinibacter haidensis]|uniref:HD-GYP domain-containing protein n=1 Tax=Teredinibacter haidensis TaxID=2731755 RepID=UPI000948948F|nr:HD domain-containing phosphohydrolase [Teredinibacter haidensis]